MTDTDESARAEIARLKSRNKVLMNENRALAAKLKAADFFIFNAGVDLGRAHNQTDELRLERDKAAKWQNVYLRAALAAVQALEEVQFLTKDRERFVMLGPMGTGKIEQVIEAGLERVKEIAADLLKPETLDTGEGAE